MVFIGLTVQEKCSKYGIQAHGLAEAELAEAEAEPEKTHSESINTLSILLCSRKKLNHFLRT